MDTPEGRVSVQASGTYNSSGRGILSPTGCNDARKFSCQNGTGAQENTVANTGGCDVKHAVQAWRPHLQKDIHLIEGVQRRATKLVVGMKGMSCEKRLKFLDMTTLETRRMSGDLIEVFEILKSIEDVKEE
jgi:hypothetical protein